MKPRISRILPPGRVPHVCTGVAGALHGLKSRGEVPSAVLFRFQQKPRNENRHPASRRCAAGRLSELSSGNDATTFPPATTLSLQLPSPICHPEYPDFPPRRAQRNTYVVLGKENHIRLTEATALDRKPGASEGAAVFTDPFVGMWNSLLRQGALVHKISRDFSRHSFMPRRPAKPQSDKRIECRVRLSPGFTKLKSVCGERLWLRDCPGNSNYPTKDR